MLKNTPSGYGLVAIVIHWVMALMVIGMFALGLYMVELTYYDAWYKGSLDLHKSLGITFMAFLLCRMAWRMRSVSPVQNGSRAMARVASGAHGLLYVLMLILVLSGYLISTADGRAIEVFGLFAIPAIPFSIANQEDIAGEIHALIAWSLILLAALHALGALKHHFIDKDTTLVRMLKVVKESKK